MSQIEKTSHIQFQRKLPQNKYANVPTQYHEIAQGMETQFINHMMNEMNKTVKSDQPDSHASKYYKGLLDHERSKIMAQTENGIGLKEIILDQIVPQHLKAQANTNGVKMYQQQAANKVQGDNNE
jgi:Rod binding domain-containing protein